MEKYKALWEKYKAEACEALKNEFIKEYGNPKYVVIRATSRTSIKEILSLEIKKDNNDVMLVVKDITKDAIPGKVNYFISNHYSIKSTNLDMTFFNDLDSAKLYFEVIDKK